MPTPSERPSEYFGKYVFNRQKMFKYLPAEVYNKMIDVMDNGARLDRSIADAVAEGMKKWAQEMGVTHYTHWFQPLTEGTAEKHDAFVEHDGKGGMMEAFSGKLLVQQDRSRMLLLSPMVVSATPSRLVAIRPGTPPHRYSSSTTHCVSPPSSSPIQVRHSTIRLPCSVPSVQSPRLPRRSAIISMRM